MKKILVIPLWFGDMFDKTTPGDINRVCQYLLRSLLFFGTKEEFLIMYPKTDNGICEPYIHSFKVDGIIPKRSKELVMDLYTDCEANNISLKTSSVDPVRNQLINQLEAFRDSEENEKNVIIFVNSVHVPLLISAVKNTFGLHEKMVLDFYSIGGVGNTEAFFFSREDRTSIEHLRFLSYLDFFIPKDPKELTTEIMLVGNRIHQMIKRQGHTGFLSNLAKTFL